jgi:peptide/nickel transport system permease protein
VNTTLPALQSRTLIGRLRENRTLRRLLRSPLSVIGLSIIGLLLICVLFAPLLTPYDPVKGNISTSYLQPQSVAHPFGTDEAGRDILSRVIFGARLSLQIALLSEGAGLALGIVVGLITGYYGGWIDAIIMRIVDVFMAFPLLIIAIALAAVLGAGDDKLIITLALTIWPFVARLVRSQVLSIRESEYVMAARLVGATDRRIMLRHILPNILTPLIVFGTLGVANVILQEAALSFLGLGGTDRAVPSWGRMLNDSRAYLLAAPWLSLYPGVAILIAVLGFNLLGDGLRDALDIRSD